MKKLKRFNIQKILADPDLRRRMVVRSTIATQAREGIDVTEQEAEDSYYVVTEGERAAFFRLAPFKTEAGENDGRHIELVRSLDLNSPECRTDLFLKDFNSIDDCPLAYDKLSLIASFFRENPKLDPGFATAVQGLATADDGRFLRYWWEVRPTDSSGQVKWCPFAKGGAYSRFYNDVARVIYWKDDGKDVKDFKSSVIRNPGYYFKAGVTWSQRNQRGFSMRRLPPGCVFAHVGSVAIPKNAEHTDFILGTMNSRLAEFMLRCFSSFGAWEVGAVRKVPIPNSSLSIQNEVGEIAACLHQKKSTWDTGNEICTRFDRPWVLQTAINGDAATLSAALDAVLDHEAEVDAELESTYARLNEAVYRLYGVNDKLKTKLEEAIGKRPPEIVWPQMEGKDRDQKRREHVDRLLLFLVKRVVEADADGLISFESVDHEPPLLERLRKELHACFPQQDPNALETEVLNELKKKTKSYRRAESLTEWLQDAFFDSHCTLYQQRPLLWHLASHQVRRVPAIGLLVHAHKFDADALAKLRSVHIRDRLTALRREAGQADRDGRQDDRIQALADIEEVEAFDAKLKLLQDGHHTGPDNGERDYRILTPWKSPAERPQGWHPDLDDGIKVNIAPLSRTGLLRKTLRFAQAENED